MPIADTVPTAIDVEDGELELMPEVAVAAAVAEYWVEDWGLEEMVEADIDIIVS